jgi:hypothetical protein
MRRLDSLATNGKRAKHRKTKSAVLATLPKRERPRNAE